MPTFGRTTPYTSSAPNSTDRCWVSKFTLSEAGNVTKLTAFFDYDAGQSSAAGDNVKAVIYADSSGSPGALLAVSSGVAIPAGDQTIDFTVSVSLTAGDYWLGIVADSTNSRINAQGGSSGNYARQESLTYASPASTFGTPAATGTNEFGIYATYTTNAALSSPTASSPSATSLAVGATTDQASGTFYVVVDTAANLAGVTATEIKAGQKAGGSAALASASAAVSSSTPSATATGLTAGPVYAYAAVQNNTNGDSNVVTGTATWAASSGPGLVVGGSSSFVGEGAVGAPDATSGEATLTPAKATLAAQGLVPTLLTTYEQIQPVGAGIVSVGGLTPALLRIQSVAPGVAGLSIGGLTPELYRELAVSPAPSALAAAGLQPALTTELRIAPGVGLATTLGQAPAVAGDSPAPEGTASPGVGAATMAGLAPTLYLERLVAPGSGAVTVQGLVPGELLELLGLPGAGAAQVQGLAPQLLRELLLQPGSALAQALGLVPAEGLERTVTPDVGLSIVNGYAPTYGVPGQAITEPGSAALAAVGLAPTLVGLELPLAPDVGVATVAGLAPTISGTSSAEPIGRSYVGQKKRGARGRTSQTIYDYSADAVVAAPTQGPPPTVPGTPQPLRISLGELGGLDLRAALAPRPAAPIVAPDDTAAAEERARIRRRREERLILSILMAA